MIESLVLLLVFGGILLFIPINYIWFNLFTRITNWSVLGWFIVNTVYLFLWYTSVMKAIEYTDII